MQESRFERPDPLGNHKFQDFLVEHGSLVRGSPDPRSCSLRYPLKEGTDRQRLWELLFNSEPGYLVPGRQISQKLYGSVAPTELWAAQSTGAKLRKRITDPDSLFAATLGQGFGIKSLNPSDEQSINALYFLWQDIGKFVHAKVLSKKLYGDTDPNALIDTSVKYYNLNNRFDFKNATIEGADFNFERYYRLRLLVEDSEKEKEAKNNSTFNGAYQKEFQDWLGSLGLIEYSKTHKRINLKEGQEFSKGYEEEVVSLLMRYGDYIIPLAALRDIYYRKRPVPEDWQPGLSKSLYELRQKLLNPEAIFVAFNIGWGFAITRMSLSKSDFLLLNKLWVNEDGFVEAERISQDTQIKKAERGAWALRKKLGQSPYLIGSRMGVNGPDYILTHQANLVLPEAA